MSVVCCEVEVSCRADRLFRGVLPSVVCLTECDHESVIMRKSWPTGGVLLHDKIKVIRSKPKT